MTQPPRDWHWLDAGEAIGMTELAQACGVSVGELQELVEYGAVRPAATREEQVLFSADCLMPLRTACRLRRDYDLDLFTVALLLEQLQRIEDLQRQVRSLRAHLPSPTGRAAAHRRRGGGASRTAAAAAEPHSGVARPVRIPSRAYSGQ